MCVVNPCFPQCNSLFILKLFYLACYDDKTKHVSVLKRKDCSFVRIKTWTSIPFKLIQMSWSLVFWDPEILISPMTILLIVVFNPTWISIVINRYNFIDMISQLIRICTFCLYSPDRIPPLYIVSSQLVPLLLDANDSPLPNTANIPNSTWILITQSVE